MRPTRRLLLAGATLLLATPLLACQTILSASVKGSRKPTTETCSPGQRVELQNGDFTITQSCLDPDNQVVGDGIAEETTWEFDLSEEDVAACYPETAMIEMQIRPNGRLLDERLRVRDRWAMGLEAIQSLEPGEEQTLRFDMMLRNGRPSPYGPGTIRDLLVDGGGKLPMHYELNALISSAEITLACRN